MNVAFASEWGHGLSWACRMQDEGCIVRMWIRKPTHKTIGNGIVPKASSWNELLAWAKVQQGETLVFFDYSGMGELADQARRYGLTVVGGCDFADKLEQDRSFGQEIAEAVGMLTPPYQNFSSVDAVQKWAAQNDCGEVYFKPDNPDMGNDATKCLKDAEELEKHCRFVIKRYGSRGDVLLQQKIDGTALSTARWWNGLSWVGPYEGTIENKKFMNENIGPSTGCSFNAVWFYQDPLPRVAQLLNWESLTRLFRLNHAAPGLYDVNVIVSKQGEAYFLEWTPRLGYDSELTSMKLMPSLFEWLWAVGNGKEPPAPDFRLAYAVRLSIPPYPNEHVYGDSKDTSKGVPLAPFESLWAKDFVGVEIQTGEDDHICGGTDGLVGIGVGVADELGEAVAIAEEAAEELHKQVKQLQYRTDGYIVLVEDAIALEKAGLETHDGFVGQG